MTRSESERFWAKVLKTDTCWLWTAGKNSKGYGIFYLSKPSSPQIVAHRYSYGQLIPEGLTIDHLCRNKACVNPSHLEVVTMRVNILRGNGVTAQEAKTTHCPRGHPYDLLNTYIWQGERHCRTCGRYPFRKSRAKRSVV